MLESLAFALFKTFIVYLFDQNLRQGDTVQIEGAPRWYSQDQADQVCASGHAKGGFEAIEQARRQAQQALARRIDEATKKTVHAEFRISNNPAEQALVKRFETDEALPQLVNAKSQFHNTEYRKEAHEAFARSCIDRPSLLGYEKERLEKLRVAVIEEYRHRAFGELESEQPAEGNAEQELKQDASHKSKGSPAESPSSSQDPFLELERSTAPR
jgi:hypothetical protein